MELERDFRHASRHPRVRKARRREARSIQRHPIQHSHQVCPLGRSKPLLDFGRQTRRGAQDQVLRQLPWLPLLTNPPCHPRYRELRRRGFPYQSMARSSQPRPRLRRQTNWRNWHWSDRDPNHHSHLQRAFHQIPHCLPTDSKLVRSSSKRTNHPRTHGCPPRWL